MENEKTDVKTMTWEELCKERDELRNIFERYLELMKHGENFSKTEYSEMAKRTGKVDKELQKRLNRGNLGPMNK